ncbi:MAG: LOG family protein [Verrucomicrobiota bacterium]
MPIVRLSGKVEGESDENRESRAKMLYTLFANGWDIYNSNGDQKITLFNIERKIQESDAFVFMPGASLEDLFKAVSIFVGYQTLDPHLFGKATVILNSDGSWNSLLKLLDDLQGFGAIRQNFRDFLVVADSPDEVLSSIDRVRIEGLPDVGRKRVTTNRTDSFEKPKPSELGQSVCVFCSASMDEKVYLEEGYDLGRLLAENQLGCVSGAGTTGVMGEVVRGAADGGGWAAGSNVPHIIELEGLPDGLSAFWLTTDIYARMEAMMVNSDKFVIFPGGAGTVQETLALLILKQVGSPLMRGKDVIIYNRGAVGLEAGFWDSLLEVLSPWEGKGLFSVETDLEGLMSSIKEG